MAKLSYNRLSLEEIKRRYSELEKTAESEIKKFNENGALAEYSIGTQHNPILFTINRKGALSNIASVFLESKRISYYTENSQDKEMLEKIAESFYENYEESWNVEKQE
jgi:hypothetical protein